MNRLPVIKDPALMALENIQHGFFTRAGGVSGGIYDSLNCAWHREDEPHCVHENRRRVAAHFGHPLAALATVRNVHGNQVAIVD